MTGHVAGMFLIATPLITTPPFARAVVFMLDHDADGAVGLIVNVDTGIPIADHLPSIAHRVTEPRTVFLGGPVTPETAVVLGRSTSASFLQPSGLDDVGLLDPDTLPDELDDLRIYAGYSGWDPAQLEAEIDEGAWWVLPASSGDVFTADADGMWDRTVGRAPGRIPLHRTYPTDIRFN